MAQKTVDVTALALRAGSGLVSADQVIVFDQTGNTDRMPFADAVAEANSQNGCVCTLDDGYDAGGAGVGREIVADTGAVKVTGTDGLIVTGVAGDGADSEWVGGGAYDTGMFFNPKKAAFRAGVVEGTEWDDANVGDASTAMGAGTTASGVASTAMGYATTASGITSTAMGSETTASGEGSTAMGYATTALGDASTAMGSATTASGNVSTAMGSETTASGEGSTAMGADTTASGDASTAMGADTTASATAATAMGTNSTASANTATAVGYEVNSKSFSETALGTYNTDYTPTSTSAFSATDRLFGVGNGTIGALSDALVILKSGKTTMPSTTGSFTPNVLTTTERNALTATAGMMIYNSTTNKHQGYDGSAWNDFY